MPTLTPQSVSISLSCFLSHLVPGTWIPIEELPSPLAHNEAVLLCQLSEHQWLSWIPDHGEYVLELTCSI